MKENIDTAHQRGPSVATNLLRKIFDPAYRFLSVIPEGIREENYWFYSISNLAYVLIALVHVAWIGVFYRFNLMPMMWVQMVSILCYVAAIASNRSGYHLTAMLVGVGEAVFHQVFAVVLLGWGSGFQNFIPLIALMPFLKHNENWVTKFFFGVCCMACYLYLDFFMKGSTPVLALTHRAADFINFSNVVLCFILVALWGIVLAYTYQQSVTALIKKRQELYDAEKAAEQTEILRQLEMKEKVNEIFQLRNVELRNSNIEILEQKKIIDELVHEQEKTISIRTAELADANKKLTHSNKKLTELIQYNSHSLREPLTRIMGGVGIVDYMSHDEFFRDILPEIGRAANELDIRIRRVIYVADEVMTYS